MKKLLLIFGMTSLMIACTNEPKLNQQETTAIEAQLAADQQAMDSLEKAIQAQMQELDFDSTEMDSL